MGSRERKRRINGIIWAEVNANEYSALTNVRQDFRDPQ